MHETAADEALRGAAHARTTLLAGFTTVRNVGAHGFADIALMRAIDAGYIDGPRIIGAAYAIGITGGHCDETGWAPGCSSGARTREWPTDLTRWSRPCAT